MAKLAFVGLQALDLHQRGNVRLGASGHITAFNVVDASRNNAARSA